MSKRTLYLLLTGTAAMSGLAASHAGAQTTPNGTAAGVLVTNTAQATYTVNGTAQSTASNPATFVVDRKVNLTVVALQSADTQVNLSETSAVTVYRVTNKTNAIQDILIDGGQNISTGVYIGTDNFDMSNLKAYVDSNGNNMYDAGVDTATFIDELAPDASATVFLVGDVPANALSQMAIVNLHATVAAGGASGTQGAALTAAILNSKDDVDVVFADDDSDGLGIDLLRDGQSRAYLAYVVGTRNVALSVTKTSTVISDGVNTLNPKALPGAVVEYCLAVRNATLTTGASAVTLTDVVPTNTTYVPGTLTIGLPGGTCVLLGTAQDDDADDDNDGGPYKGHFDTTTKTVTAIVPTVAGGGVVSAAFRVTIN